jgi:DTW domain-containing protein YfiP
MSSTEQSLSEKLRQQGYDGLELFEKIATRTVELKEKSRTNRCHRCWHDKDSRCICSHIPPLAQVKLPIKIMVLMHYKEYFSAGNDAKLLLAMMPEELKELYLFGKEGDWDKFETECALDPNHTFLLWPAEDALTVDGLVHKLPIDSPWRECQQVENTQQIIEKTTRMTEENKSIGKENSKISNHSLPTLRVIVLDGVYSQARSMFRTIKRRFPPSLVPPYVALHPTTLSVYHRAQKSYSQSSGKTVQNSSNPDALHICTVEAFALLMKEFGEWEETTSALVRAVEVNNLALVHSVDVRPPTSTLSPSS